MRNSAWVEMHATQVFQAQLALQAGPLWTLSVFKDVILTI